MIASSGAREDYPSSMTTSIATNVVSHRNIDFSHALVFMGTRNYWKMYVVPTELRRKFSGIARAEQI